jgi:hypothetical protein
MLRRTHNKYDKFESTLRANFVNFSSENTDSPKDL